MCMRVTYLQFPPATSPTQTQNHILQLELWFYIKAKIPGYNMIQDLSFSPETLVPALI